MTPYAILSDPDAALDARRGSFACAACKSPDPAAIYAAGCSDCKPRAFFCWVCGRRSDHDDFDARTVTLPSGRSGVLCGKCYERGTPEVPLSYEEWNGEDD